MLSLKMCASPGGHGVSLRSGRLRTNAWPRSHGTTKSPTLLLLAGLVSHSSGARGGGLSGASSAGLGVGGVDVLRLGGGRGRPRGDVAGSSRRLLRRWRRLGLGGGVGVVGGLAGVVRRRRRLGSSAVGEPSGRGRRPLVWPRGPRSCASCGGGLGKIGHGRLLGVPRGPTRARGGLSAAAAAAVALGGSAAEAAAAAAAAAVAENRGQVAPGRAAGALLGVWGGLALAARRRRGSASASSPLGAAAPAVPVAAAASAAAAAAVAVSAKSGHAGSCLRAVCPAGGEGVTND